MKPFFMIPDVSNVSGVIPVLGFENVEDLIQREGLVYEKFTDVLFTGETDETLYRGSYHTCVN